MKYKYLKLAQTQLIPAVAPLVGAAVEGSAEAAALSKIKDILGGGSDKSMLDEAVSHFKDKAKLEQFQGAEDFSNFGSTIETLKDHYVSSGFSPKEFDSYFPEFFNLENPSKVLRNPKVQSMDAKTIIEIMTLAKDEAAAASISLRKVFDTFLMFYAKTRNLNLAKDIIKRGVKLENEVAGVGILDSIVNAMRGNVSETNLMMALLGTPELMREYTEVIAQATGHKLAPAELIRRDAETAKKMLDQSIIEFGLAKGIQNAIESVAIRQQMAQSEKVINNLFRNTTGFTGFFRNIYYYLWMGDNIAVEGSSAAIPSNVGLKPELFKFNSSNAKRLVTSAVTSVMSTPRVEAELKKLFFESMTNTQRILNKNYQADASTLIDLIVRAKVARDMNNPTAYASIRPSINAILVKKGFKNDYNIEFITTVNSILTLLDNNQPITTQATQQAEQFEAPEEISKLAPNKDEAERFKIARQRYDEAVKTYTNLKNSLYGDPGSSMIAGNAKELGQTKLVPYKSPEQVKTKIASAQESIKLALGYNAQLSAIYERWISNPAAYTGKSQSVINATLTRLKFLVTTLRTDVEKMKADSFELKSEGLTVEETMKQRNERFMGGGQLAAELSGLAASAKGTAYGLAGGVAELNKLLDSQIATQEQKIQKLQAALSSASSAEERMALEGQLKHADIEKELLKNKLFQQTNDALQGKFDPSFYTDAMSAPGISRTSSAVSKFVMSSKFIKESDAEIEDYYNELYEDTEDSPEYGTALEHPQETRNILTKDIPKHKHKKSSKYILN